MIKAKVLGTGSYLPVKKETADDFVKKGASRELIDKWGVFEHRVMGEDETVTDMEAEAAKIAIERAGLKPEDIELIISGTAMPRQIGVPNSNALQHMIGAKKAAAFDVLMACGSAIPEIVIAAQFIASKQYRHILVTGSCFLTRVADPTDPAAYMVLGDGAGAMVLGPADDGCGIISFDIQTKGEYFDYCGSKVRMPKKTLRETQYYEPPQERFYFHIGDVENSSSGVMKYVLTSLPSTVKKAMEKARITPKDVNMLISHQNIAPLVENWVSMMGIPLEKTHFTYPEFGNMSAANIFVNLDEAVKINKIKKGDIVVFAGQGAGFSVGSIIMRWG